VRSGVRTSRLGNPGGLGRMVGGRQRQMAAAAGVAGGRRRGRSLPAAAAAAHRAAGRRRGCAEPRLRHACWRRTRPPSPCPPARGGRAATAAARVAETSRARMARGQRRWRPMRLRGRPPGLPAGVPLPAVILPSPHAPAPGISSSSAGNEGGQAAPGRWCKKHITLAKQSWQHSPFSRQQFRCCIRCMHTCCVVCCACGGRQAGRGWGSGRGAQLGLMPSRPWGG